MSDMTTVKPGQGVYLGSQYHVFEGPRVVAGTEIPELCMISRLGGEPFSAFRKDLLLCTEADERRGAAYRGHVATQPRA